MVVDFKGMIDQGVKVVFHPAIDLDKWYHLKPANTIYLSTEMEYKFYYAAFDFDEATKYCMETAMKRVESKINRSAAFHSYMANMRMNGPIMIRSGENLEYNEISLLDDRSMAFGIAYKHSLLEPITDHPCL